MKSFSLTDQVYEYIQSYLCHPSPVLPQLIEETEKLADSMMQISPDQGSFLHVLTKIVGAKRIIEIGCYTGYSAISMASALPKDGKLITLDINPETTKIATKYFSLAGLSDQIELRLNPAADSLAQLKSEYGDGTFDMAFIDADKVNMVNYYEKCLELMRPGGIIVADNVLWSGKVADCTISDESTIAIRKFNEHVTHDDRVEATMMHISDGIYLIRKK